MGHCRFIEFFLVRFLRDPLAPWQSSVVHSPHTPLCVLLIWGTKPVLRLSQDDQRKSGLSRRKTAGDSEQGKENLSEARISL
jgi:hypothetical protein